MSRPQKIHLPIKGDFNNILAAIAMGGGAGKKAAQKLAKEKFHSKSDMATSSKKP